MLGALTFILPRVRSRASAVLLALLASLPVLFIAQRVATATRDVAYWDEFDTALSFVLQLDTGVTAREFFDRLFALSNEHRMVTSRLMFAASYWLTGTVDFSVISFLGNASLIALCALLIHAVKTPVRRVQLSVVLALTVFQLQNYENFLWAGSSIDHFQVILLAGAAVVGVARATRASVLVAAACAVLATFTLAHGIITWLIGAAMLWRERRWSQLGIWATIALFAVTGFLAGFHLNTAQHFAEPTFAGAWLVAKYWLTLLGVVPALGNATIAPWLGGTLLMAVALLGRSGAWSREPVVFPVIGYALAALALIAIGRAAESGGLVHSRYYVLGALAWGLTIFVALDRFSPKGSHRLLWGCAPLLVVFNVAADHLFSAKADAWLECRDRAALRFKQHGVDGRGPFALYPAPTRSTQLLNEAEQRGVYRMAPICEERSYPDAHPSARITYYVEEMDVTPRAAAVGGWAAIPGLPSKRGQIHIVLRSGDATHVFTAVTVTRPDVAAALKQPDCTLAGFRFARRRDRLPTGEFQVGFLIKNGGQSEYIMTEHRLRLVGDGEALLAGGD